MVTIGNDTLPGTITTLESASTVGINIGAPGVATIVGQGYLQGASDAVDANTVVRVTRPNQARAAFGPAEDSNLTQNINDALAEGAYPVYGVAPPEESTTDDLSAESGTTGSVSETPVHEVESDITFTINSTSKDTVLYTAGDPHNVSSVPSGEVYLNPQSGNFQTDEAMGNAGDEVSFGYLDYTADTFDAVNNFETVGGQFLRDLTDFIGTTDEDIDVKDSLETHVDDMENNGDFAIAIAGAGDGGYVAGAETADDQTSDYSDNYDNSRVQLIAPSRDDEGRSIIGSYVGARSRIGIDSTPIFKPLRTQTGLQTNLSTGELEDLVNAKVIPIEERSDAARIYEDVTTVADDNTDEEQWQQGISRLVTDFVAELARDETDEHVGEFNDEVTLNNVRGDISAGLKQLLESRQLEAYTLAVEEIDSMTAAVDIGIDTADPLRNIELTVSAGAVRNGVSVEGV